MAEISNNRRRGFTLVELMVAISILVVVILAIGKVFQSTGKAVSQAQALTDLLSNIRAIQTQMQRDLQGLDKDGYLVIRSDNANGSRTDQVAFIALGQFPHRTGVDSATPFVDSFSTNAAAIWYGHLVFETNPQQSTNPVPVSDANLAGSGMSLIPPTPAVAGTGSLGRSAMLLASRDTATPDRIKGGAIPAFPNTVLGSTLTTAISADGGFVPDITSSRVDAAGVTPGQLMSSIITGRGASGAGNRYEADKYCFRFKTLTDVYEATDVNKIPNSYFRMHPILLQGVTAIAVDWTDGSLDGTNNNSLKWFGGTGTGAYSGAGTLPAGTEPTLGNGDTYTAIFSTFNKSAWPKALRITITASDPLGRLPGPRTFTQVVKLP